MKNDAFYPGRIWLDTEGKRIQAHGGSIIRVGSLFYWYGENKEKTTGENQIWHNGVRAYSSADLYNWTDEGIIIPPDTENIHSPLHPTSMMDRPHIMYQESTGKYVAWLKIMNEPGHFAVLTADHFKGPYTMLHPEVHPYGQPVGDFDILQDEKSGKAYLVSQKPHTCIYVADLNREGTDVSGEYSEHFPHMAPPQAREAPACFIRNGKYYIITSGTTGYDPNPSEAAIADQIHGPYVVQGNPHKKDPTETSFNSQISSVYKVPGKKDLYIALADRWKPELPMREGENFSSGAFSKQIQNKFQQIFDPATRFVFTEEDAREMRINASVSDYVWLPLLFHGEQAEIEWADCWRLDDFE